MADIDDLLNRANEPDDDNTELEETEEGTGTESFVSEELKAR